VSALREGGGAGDSGIGSTRSRDGSKAHSTSSMSSTGTATKTTLT
jgi:hypothetical protein